MDFKNNYPKIEYSQTNFLRDTNTMQNLIVLDKTFPDVSTPNPGIGLPAVLRSAS